MRSPPYALSPVDVIPDFTPVRGRLLIVPLGILLAVKIVPAALMEELRRKALRAARPRPVAGLAFIAAIWIVAAWLAWQWWQG